MGMTTVKYGASALYDNPNFPPFGSLPYVSGRRYLAGPPSVGITSTNASPFVANTMYGIVTPINQRVSLSGMGLRTSSSNASVSGQFIGVIYALNSSLVPTTLVASTPATSVGDSVINTDIPANFSSALILEQGNYFFGFLANGGNIRASVYSSANPWNSYSGGSTLGLAMAGTPTIGYKTADGAVSFAGGAPSSFGSATALTSVTPSASSITPLVGLLVS